MDTDEHRFRGPNRRLALAGLGSLSGEWKLAVKTAGFEQSLSVFIRVHLWWYFIATAKLRATHGKRARSISIRNSENGRLRTRGTLVPVWYHPGPTLVP